MPPVHLAPPNGPSDASLSQTNPSNHIPTHLYSRLPAHHLLPDGTPDYLKLILLSRTYAPPLNMQETPLTKAVNLSAKLGNEIWLKREDMQEVFSFKLRGAYNFMSSLGKEERWKGVVTCSAGPFSLFHSLPLFIDFLFTLFYVLWLWTLTKREPRSRGRFGWLQARYPMYDRHARRHAHHQMAQRRAPRC